MNAHLCLTNCVRGKYQKGNLSRHICRMCKSSTETRNLASLSGNDDSDFFSSHAFYLFSRDTVSSFKTFPHCISAGNVNTIQDSATAFSGEKHLLSNVTTGHSPHGEALRGGVMQLDMSWIDHSSMLNSCCASRADKLSPSLSHFPSHAVGELGLEYSSGWPLM